MAKGAETGVGTGHNGNGRGGNGKRRGAKGSGKANGNSKKAVLTLAISTSNPQAPRLPAASGVYSFPD